MQLLERGTCFHAYTGATFNLKAICMWSKHNFLAYKLFAGRVTKGHMECPPCDLTTKVGSSRKLKRMLYCGSHMYLPRSHPYWKAHTTFNVEIKLKATHVWVSTKDVTNLATYQETWLQGPRNRGSGKFDPIHKHGVKRLSTMFQLPYWKVIFLFNMNFNTPFWI